jgi:hypothetical protein
VLYCCTVRVDATEAEAVCLDSHCVLCRVSCVSISDSADSDKGRIGSWL